MTTRIEKGHGWELRLGDYREVLADVAECDAVITDPPYSERTHSGHDAGVSDGRQRRSLDYASFSAADVLALVGQFCSANRGWFACMSDSELFAEYRQNYSLLGLTAFAPLPIVIPGMTVRLGGDGPSSWAVYLNVGRPKSLARWGTLPGAYIRQTGDASSPIIGGKPLGVMRAIVRDYSRKGDLIVDPCAGGATTLLAAVIEGRRAIGAEIDPETFDKAVKRLRSGYTPQFEGM